MSAPDNGITIFDGMDFGLRRSLDISPDNTSFPLHNHDDVYELVLFLKGNAEFQVEGHIYPIRPYDLLLTRPFELHRIVCDPSTPYERIVIFIHENYFESCKEYEEIFTNRPLGEGNLIPSEIVRNDLLDCIMRIEKYISSGVYNVAAAVLTEFLYLLNRSKSNVEVGIRDIRIASITAYINDHLREKITLDALAEHCYMDKSHMCRRFKKSTGYTLSGYINYKRILLARQLHNEGQSLSEASVNAGFNNYSHFYRMCRRLTGEAPKELV